MTSFTLFTLCLAALSRTSLAGYVLSQGGNYTQDVSTFFEQWSFFTEADPTAGTVTYIDESAAQAAGMINTNDGQIYMGVDATTKTTSGRNSVRLTSTASYNTGLFILDLEHMPGGICGTWPAFWLVGPNWPNDGEIDIIEGVNNQVGNDMTLHTGPGCSVTNDKSAFTGNMVGETCTSSNADNNGCQIADSSAASYGTGFNAAKGGVYAMEWTEAAISVWFFPRGSIPADVASMTPDPTTWGTPVSYFSGCDIPSHFQDMQMVFDTTFCGTWGGQVFEEMCPGLGDCASYVQNNPTAFADAYWTINSLSVFTSDGTTGSGSSSIVPSSTKAPVTVSTPSSVPVAHSATTKPTTLATSAVSASKSSTSVSTIATASIPVVKSSSTAAVVSVPSVLSSSTAIASMPNYKSSSTAAMASVPGYKSSFTPSMASVPTAKSSSLATLVSVPVGKSSSTAAVASVPVPSEPASSKASAMSSPGPSMATASIPVVSAHSINATHSAASSAAVSANVPGQSAAPTKVSAIPPIATASEKPTVSASSSIAAESLSASVMTASVHSTILATLHSTKTVHTNTGGAMTIAPIASDSAAASSGIYTTWGANVTEPGYAHPTGTGSPRPWHHHHHGHKSWSYSAGVSSDATQAAPTILVHSALAETGPVTLKVKTTVTVCTEEPTGTPLPLADFPNGSEAIPAPTQKRSLHFASHKRRGGAVLGH